MSLQQFRKTKEQMMNLVQKANDEYEKNKDNATYDNAAHEQELLEAYSGLQDQLLSHDLSEIPFEEWKGLEIFSDEAHPANFSKTKANIDFALLKYYGNGNFKGCHVRNLDQIPNYVTVDPDSFDDETINQNPSLFLSTSFSKEFRDKYYHGALAIQDLANLSPSQIEELKNKRVNSFKGCSTYLVELLGLEKVVQLYKHSTIEFETLDQILEPIISLDYISHQFNKQNEKELLSYKHLYEELKKVEVADVKEAVFDFAKRQIIEERFPLVQRKYPKLFIEENKDLFLIDVPIDEEVKQRYFSKHLTFQDVLKYRTQFETIPIDNFMENTTPIATTFGIGKLQTLIEKHPDVFMHIAQKKDLNLLWRAFHPSNDLEKSFRRTVRDYYLDYYKIDDSNPQVEEDPFAWLSSMHFQFVKKLRTPSDLWNYNDSMVVLSRVQTNAFDILGIEQIKQFEQETGFFTHEGRTYTNGLEMLDAVGDYLLTHKKDYLLELGIDFHDGDLPYEEWKNQFAKCLDNMRKNNFFTDFTAYDWMEGNFRNQHPELFISKDAPKELRTYFYKNGITPLFLHARKEYIPYLIDKNLENTLNATIELMLPALMDANGNILPSKENFIKEYVARYGNEKLLQLVSKYGDVLSNITISSMHHEIDNESSIEQAIKTAIYNKIIHSDVRYGYLVDTPDFVQTYPDLFVRFDDLPNLTQEEKQRLTNAFYSRTLSYDDIRQHKELIPFLKDKNLHIAFGKPSKTSTYNRKLDLELIDVFGNEAFLNLCSKYGRYMNNVWKQLNDETVLENGQYKDTLTKKMLSIEDMKSKIENIIAYQCKTGNLDYNPTDAPSFLKEQYPSLFLNKDAPLALQEVFYNRGFTHPLTFKLLQQHKEWTPFLEGKNLVPALLRGSQYKDSMMHYFQVFGEEKALNLGIHRADTVMAMIDARQVDKMKDWYDKTGKKFIPDVVVMQNFSLDESDKFLTSGANWGNLMRIKSFASTLEGRDAMLKLAYSFGAFDHDQRGFKKLQDLLTNLPRKIDESQSYIFHNLDMQIDQSCQRAFFFSNPSLDSETAYNQMMAYVEKNQNKLFDNIIWTPLLKTLKEENVVDFSKPILSQIYKENEDGSLSLAINPQSCPKSSQMLREILGVFRELPILTPTKAHQLFGGFDLKYDVHFREFLLANIDEVLSTPKGNYIASIQKQFTDIRSINSNRSLTLDLAISYVQTNKYTSVQTGNEKVAEIAAIAGYSQEDFNTLQEIYNYGRQRTFSSIPRIEKQAEKRSGTYRYETLKLDDPLAMAIGTLTDCCQELNNCAEMCMEHSMVDKNGRVFVIKDELGQIVAQSWVWRNKDVLCFDNIEIPDKTFTRVTRENPDLGRQGFTDEIFEIYKQAAKDLIEEDEKSYQALLERGQITIEQYEGLRLGKVTVGLGYNDIAESLQKNATVDTSMVARPLPFEAPVNLSRALYTSDSMTQYILDERSDRKEYTGETLPIYHDRYTEYQDDNFSYKDLLTLKKLEMATKGDLTYLETSSINNSDHIVTSLAYNYDLNPDTTRVIMNPNFALIYDVNENKIKVGDLFFNTEIPNQKEDIESKVALQIKLAFDQLGKEKEIDTTSLDEKQKTMVSKAMGLADEIDSERGVGHAK